MDLCSNLRKYTIESLLKDKSVLDEYLCIEDVLIETACNGRTECKWNFNINGFNICVAEDIITLLRLYGLNVCNIGEGIINISWN